MTAKPHARILTPTDPSPALTERFAAAMADAMTDLQRFTAGRTSGTMVLFDDGDYVCFSGVMTPEGDAVTVTVNAILAQKLDEGSARSKVYSRLIPGSTLKFSATGLSSPEGVEAPWEEHLRRGEEFDLITFGP